MTRNEVDRSTASAAVAGGGVTERQRLIDALAAASVVSNSASPRASGKLKCLDVASFHQFVDDYQQLTCTRDVVTRLVQVASRSRDDSSPTQIYFNTSGSQKTKTL